MYMFRCLPKVDNIFDLKESLFICNNHVLLSCVCLAARRGTLLLKDSSKDFI